MPYSGFVHQIIKNESSYLCDHIKLEIKNVRCSDQELQWFKKKSKWSVQLPGIDLAHEKNAIFAVTGSGVRRWLRPRY